MLQVYILIVLIVLYYVLYHYFTRTLNFWQKKNVPGPPPVAFFGNLKEAVFRQKHIGVLFQEFYNMFPKEKVVGVYRMTTPCLLIRDLDVIKHIMIKDANLFTDRGIEFSTKGLGQNLFHADGDTWTALRTNFNPIFTPGKLRNMFHLLNDCTDTFVNHVENQSRINPEYEISTLVKKCTISTISACAFGIDLDNFYTDQAEELKTIDRIALEPNYAIELDFMFPGLLKKLNLSLFPATVTDFFKNLVTSIAAQRCGKPSARGDFMDLILGLRQSGEIRNLRNKEGTKQTSTAITDDIIAAQVFIFYMAGYETSATTMSYLLYELARNPKIQDKLIEEIDNVTKADGGKITYESLKEMKYLEKAFLETLRLYSILEPLQRKAKEEYKIPGSTLVIEKDQMVLIPVRGIHHDEKYYPNPEVFDPERFNPEAIANRHPCAYLPFGLGPRNCIGMRFGKLQSLLGIAKILGRFRVEASKNTKNDLGIEPNRVIVGPKEVIYLNIVPRK